MRSAMGPIANEGRPEVMARPQLAFPVDGLA